MTTNPLAKTEKSTIITSSKKKEVEEKPTGFVKTELAGMNKAIDIISEACSSCWDKKIPDDWAGRAEYVAKRTRTGHTSILEHSNFVVCIDVPTAYMDDMVTFLSWVKYLNKKVYHNSNGNWNILLGGSYRGYSDIYLQCTDLNNALLKSVANCLYMYAPSAAFEDICNSGLMDIGRFVNAEPDPENYKYLTYECDDNSTEKFDIVGIDDIKILRRNIWNINKEFCAAISNADLIQFVTVTILFKNMSRIITQQLCRHRNGITQESQRYVDYSDSCFNSPAKFKDRYDPNHKYSIVFGGVILNMTLQELGEAMCNVYGQLTNPTDGEYPLLREDARGYLPSNVQCRKIYMTFTYATIFKFLQLREAKGAQAEIREYGIEIGEWIRSHTDFNTKEITDSYTRAKLLIGFATDTVDDMQSVTDDGKDITEEDYLNYLNRVENTSDTEG